MGLIELQLSRAVSSPPAASMLLRLTLFCSLLYSSQAIFKYPWHASCKINWEIPESCQTFKSKIISQMNAWQGDSLCPGTSNSCPDMPCGQRCLYQFRESSQNYIYGTHQTPVARYTDDLTIHLAENGSGGCSVRAKSNSQTWYAVLDYGTNYCNLRNLVDGAGLSAAPGFSEETSNSVCTQYTSRDCSRF